MSMEQGCKRNLKKTLNKSRVVKQGTKSGLKEGSERRRWRGQLCECAVCLCLSVQVPNQV